MSARKNNHYCCYSCPGSSIYRCCFSCHAEKRRLLHANWQRLCDRDRTTRSDEWSLHMKRLRWNRGRKRTELWNESDSHWRCLLMPEGGPIPWCRYLGRSAIWWNARRRAGTIRW